MKFNNSFIGKCLHDVQHYNGMQLITSLCVDLKSASTILRVSNSGRYGSMLHHSTVVRLLYCFQHAWFHRAR